MYLSTKELSKKWGVNESRILRLAREGRIEGAVHFGKSWMFPQDIRKPIDRRTSYGKKEKNEDYFRFPLYLNFDEKTYNPPLNEEEKLLREAQIAFQACEFDKASKIAIPLSINTKDRYIRLGALYLRCYLAILANNHTFDDVYNKMKEELEKDFPFKKEMMLLKYGYEADQGFYGSIINDFEVDPEYSYHPSAYWTYMLVSIIAVQRDDFTLIPKIKYDSFELLCQEMEREGYFLESQKMHYLLLIVYQVQGDMEKSHYHIRRGLELAMEHNLYWAASRYASLYPEPTIELLKTFPRDFAKKIISLSKITKERWDNFSNTRDNPSFLGVLASREYRFAFLANQGYTNKEVAEILHVSEKTVSRMYSEIYTQLGVKGKRELVELINSTHMNSHVE